MQCVTGWLWWPRDVAVRRITKRGTADAADRLRASWDEVEPQPEADISVNTTEVHSVDTAAGIQ